MDLLVGRSSISQDLPLRPQSFKDLSKSNQSNNLQRSSDFPRSILPYDVYVGRPSKWGNPFVVGRDGSRSEVIQKYRTG
ncbi:MAG: DUF4326 domain-containing protein [Acidiferrobacterales bacterium]